MHYTMMNGYQARNILKGIRNAIFDEEIVLKIIDHKRQFIEDRDTTYYQIRESSAPNIKTRSKKNRSLKSTKIRRGRKSR